MNVDFLVSLVAGAAFISAPITSYGDTVYNIYKDKSSAGFSIDVCGIMLISSILRVFFYFSKPYEMSLFIQAIVMIAIQLALLKLVLDYRPRRYPGGPLDVADSHLADSSDGDEHITRPFSFWQWADSDHYWRFLAQFTVGLAIGQVILGNYSPYFETVGLLGLLIESVLPLPQIIVNHRRSSVEGFRLTLLASWIAGDVSKISFFFYAKDLSFQFQLSAFIQTFLDLIIALQYVMYTSGKWKGDAVKLNIVNRQRARSIKLQGVQID